MKIAGYTVACVGASWGLKVGGLAGYKWDPKTRNLVYTTRATFGEPCSPPAADIAWARAQVRGW